MIKKRLKHFRNMNKEEFERLSHNDFLVSEIDELINETPMSIDERVICFKSFVDCENLKANYLWKKLLSTLKKML